MKAVPPNAVCALGVNMCAVELEQPDIPATMLLLDVKSILYQ